MNGSTSAGDSASAWPPAPYWNAYVVVGALQRGTARFRVTPGVAVVDTVGLLGTFTGLSHVERRGGEILVARVLLRFPWASTVIFLGRNVYASVGPFALRRIVCTLEEAGFDVAQRRYWLFPRSSAIPEGELVRVR